jgi:hypothetical protein
MANIKLRQELERRIARRIVKDAIAAGYTVGVNDSEETTLERCGDVRTVMSKLCTTDEDWLLIYKDGKQIGWVRLIYGNDGWDVVNDYTVNLDPIMEGANKIADKYS